MFNFFETKFEAASPQMNQLYVNIVVFIICIIYVVLHLTFSNSAEAAMPSILKTHFLPELEEGK